MVEVACDVRSGPRDRGETAFFGDRVPFLGGLLGGYVKQPFSVSQVRTADSIISC